MSYSTEGALSVKILHISIHPNRRLTPRNIEHYMISNLRHLGKYQDLFLVFIWREFSIRYRQSVFGILWALVQPLSMMLLFTFVFTFVMPVTVSSYPYPLFFYAALLPWSFFSSSLNYAIPSLVSHYNLITKIYFPKEILPLAGVALAFIDLLIASLLFFTMMVYYGTPLSLNILWFVPLVVLLVMFTVSMSLILSALNVYYRDVKLAINFLIQLWFFATPIFYSIDRVPQKYKLILFLNPLTFVIENMRRCLIEARSVVLWQFYLMLIWNICLLVISFKFFRNTEKRFADVI
jgi:lipopolysaccharide transport system permease protein